MPKVLDAQFYFRAFVDGSVAKRALEPIYFGKPFVLGDELVIEIDKFTDAKPETADFSKQKVIN